jgi:hypothetical protein
MGVRIVKLIFIYQLSKNGSRWSRLTVSLLLLSAHISKATNKSSMAIPITINIKLSFSVGV